MIIGNKCDLKCKVKYQDSKEFAEKYNIQYFETSCLLDKNIKKVIIYLLNEIINSKLNYDTIPNSLIKSENVFEINKDNNERERESFCRKFWNCLNPLNWFK